MRAHSIAQSVIATLGILLGGCATDPSSDPSETRLATGDQPQCLFANTAVFKEDAESSFQVVIPGKLSKLQQGLITKAVQESGTESWTEKPWDIELIFEESEAGDVTIENWLNPSTARVYTAIRFFPGGNGYGAIFRGSTNPARLTGKLSQYTALVSTGDEDLTYSNAADADDFFGEYFSDATMGIAPDADDEDSTPPWMTVTASWYLKSSQGIDKTTRDQLVRAALASGFATSSDLETILAQSDNGTATVSTLDSKLPGNGKTCASTTCEAGYRCTIEIDEGDNEKVPMCSRTVRKVQFQKGAATYAVTFAERDTTPLALIGINPINLCVCGKMAEVRDPQTQCVTRYTCTPVGPF